MSNLSFAASLIPTFTTPFTPDPEVHRLRQEIQILDAKLQTASLVERIDLNAKLRVMEWKYEAAMDSADPSQLFCPEFLRQTDIDMGNCPHFHQSI